jgi:hypothetical protein
MDDELQGFGRSYYSGIGFEKVEKTTKANYPMFLRRFSMISVWCRGSSVSIVSRLRAGLSGNRILTQARDYLFSPKSPDRLRLLSSILFKQ